MAFFKLKMIKILTVTQEVINIDKNFQLNVTQFSFKWFSADFNSFWDSYITALYFTMGM